MTPEFRAGMIRAAEIAGDLSRKTFAEASAEKDGVDRIAMKASAVGMGNASIAILEACETEPASNSAVQG